MGTTTISTWETHLALCRSLVADRVSEDSIILEVGGGHSPFDHVRDLTARHRISTDVDLGELRRARQRVGSDTFHLLAADGHRLPFSDGSLTGIVAAYVFEHLADPLEFLEEARRVLRPGGFIFAVTPNLANPLYFPIMLVPLRPREMLLRRLGGHHDHRYMTYLRANSLRRLRTLASKAGFRIATSALLWDDHYLGKLPGGQAVLDFLDRWGSGTPLETFAGRLYLLLEKVDS